MDKKTIVKSVAHVIVYVTYGASAVALISLANVAPVQVGVLVVSALVNIFYVNKFILW